MLFTHNLQVVIFLVICAVLIICRKSIGQELHHLRWNLSHGFSRNFFSQEILGVSVVDLYTGICYAFSFLHSRRDGDSRGRCKEKLVSRAVQTKLWAFLRSRLSDSCSRCPSGASAYVILMPYSKPVWWMEVGIVEHRGCGWVVVG